MPHSRIIPLRRALGALATAVALLPGTALGQGYDRYGAPQHAYPQQAYPQQAYPQQTYPQQAYPQAAQPYGGVQARGYAVPNDPSALQPQHGGASDRYGANEVLTAGHEFFGATSGSLGGMIERVFARYGLPNGYILGEEASGAWFGGLTYGEGVMHTRNAGSHRVYWQGPSIGLDWGAQGSRTMILVYNLPHVDAALGRFGGVAGEAFAVGGLGARVLHKHGVTMVPIRTGVGARVGVNVNYLKFTPRPTWNPL